MKINKNNKVGEISTTLNIDVKLTLWNAIKMRIAGIGNLIKKENIINKG